MLALTACRGAGGARTPTPPPDAPTASAAAATPAASSTATLGAAAPDGERALASVRKLAAEIGPRVAGTPGEIAARDYLRGELEGYGYDVTLQDFGFDASNFLPARVDTPAGAVPAFILSGSGSGTARGRLVPIGEGGVDEIPAGGLAGAIALVERSATGGLTFSQKAGNAINAGAAGVVIYNNVEGNFVGKLAQPVTIPVVSIRQSAGQDLAAQAAAGPVDATITVSPPKGTAYNVVAKPRGVSTCQTVTGGHYDSVAVTGGADDNASGAAAVLEVARVEAAAGKQAANCFVLFSAEEFGLFGSKAYVQSMSPPDLSAVRAMLNLDVVGVASGLELIGDDAMTDTARIAGGTVHIDARVSFLPTGTGSDHLSFQDAGVPVVMFTRGDGLIHTPEDAIDRITADSLRDSAAIALATLDALNAR